MQKIVLSFLICLLLAIPVIGHEYAKPTSVPPPQPTITKTIQVPVRVPMPKARPKVLQCLEKEAKISHIPQKMLDSIKERCGVK